MQCNAIALQVARKMASCDMALRERIDEKMKIRIRIKIEIRILSTKFYKIASVLRRISLDERHFSSECGETFDVIFILY